MGFIESPFYLGALLASVTGVYLISQNMSDIGMSLVWLAVFLMAVQVVYALNDHGGWV